MSKRPYFRTRFGKQRVSRFETLLESARQHYYRMLPWIRDKLIRKKFILVRSEILGLFLNTLTAEYQYYRRNMHNFPQQIQMKLSQKRKALSGFFITYLKGTSSLKYLEKKDEPLSLSIPEIINSTGSGYLNV